MVEWPVIRSTTDRGRRPPRTWDTLRGDDAELQAELAEALLADVTPEEEHAIAVEGARQALRLGVSEDDLEALYGVTPAEVAARRPAPPHPRDLPYGERVDELQPAEHEHLLRTVRPSAEREARRESAAQVVLQGWATPEVARRIYGLEEDEDLPEMERFG